MGVSATPRGCKLLPRVLERRVQAARLAVYGLATSFLLSETVKSRRVLGFIGFIRLSRHLEFNMKLPKIERAIHSSKKEHIQMIGYSLLKLVESIVFLGTFGFFCIELGRPYLSWIDDED
jgi:hypothetical protein